MLESIVSKRKRSAARGIRDEEDPLAGVPNLLVFALIRVMLNLFQHLPLLSCSGLTRASPPYLSCSDLIRASRSTIKLIN